MQVVCCVCKKQKVGEQWIRGAPPADPLVSHGYCPACAARVRLEIERLRQKQFALGIPSSRRSSVA